MVSWILKYDPKKSWNQVNHFPHHSFPWQGIDGSAVLAHMLPEETW